MHHMRQFRFAGNLLKAFPSLPYLSLGLWMAWNFLACNSTVWIGARSASCDLVAQVNICVCASTAAALLAFQAFAPKLARAAASPWFSLAGGIVATLGSVVMLACANLAPSTLPSGASSGAVLGCAAAAAGAGNAFSAVKAAAEFGKLMPRHAMAKLGYATLLAVGVYFLCLGTPAASPFGTGPGAFQATVFALLPALAGCFAAMEPRHQGAFSAQPEQEPSTQRRRLPKAFWHMVAVVGVLTFSSAVVDAFGCVALPQEEAMTIEPFSLLLQGAVALAFVGVAVSLDSTRLKFGRIVTVVMLATILGIAAVAFAGAAAPMLYLLLPFAVQVFGFLSLCMVFFVMYQRTMSALTVFGAAYGVYAACAGAGWVAGMLAYPQAGQGSVLFLASALMCIATLGTAFMLFSEKQFDSLFEETESPQDSLSSLMGHSFTPPLAAVASRGRFTIAVDVIADDFGLSRREKDVLRHVAMGHVPAKTAEELGISWNTVRTHTRNLYAKLGVHSRQEVADLVESYQEE